MPIRITALLLLTVLSAVPFTLAQSLQYEIAMKKARLALQARQFTQAINALKEAVEADSEQLEAHALLSQIFLQQERWADAEPHARKASMLRSDLPDLQYNLGVALLRLKQYSASAAAFAAALRLKPDDVVYVQALFQSQEKGKFFAESLVTAERWLQLTPNNVEALMQKTSTLWELKRRNEAMEVLQQAITLQPEDAQLYQVRGYLLLNLGRNQEAIAALRQSLNLNPSDKDVEMTLNSALNRVKESDGVQRWLAETRKHPDDAHAHHQLGEAYRAVADYPSAITAYRQALALNPKNEDVHLDLGIVQGENGNHEQAAETFLRLVEINPKNVAALMNLGSSYLRLNQYEKAITHLSAGIKLKPDTSYFIFYLGQAYAALERWESAVEAFERSVKLKGDFPNSRYQLGIAYAHTGNQKGLLEQHRVLTKLAPQLAEELAAWLNK